MEAPDAKRATRPSSLPELPPEVWGLIASKTAGISELFESMNEAQHNASDAVACVREVNLLNAVGPVRLVCRGFAQSLGGNQLYGACSVALRMLRTSSQITHKAKLDSVTDNLPDDFDQNNVEDMCDVTMKAGCVMGIGRGLQHMCAVMESAAATAFRLRKDSELKGIIEAIRCARKDADRVYANLHLVRFRNPVA